MSPDQPSYLRQLRQLIDEHFNLEEIKTLTFDLGLDYEHLAGETRPSKIVSLLLYLVRRGELSNLIDLLYIQRQSVQWPDMPPDTILKSDFITLSVTGEYRDLLDPGTRYLTGLIYDLSGHEGPLEYVGLRGEVQVKGTGSGTANSVGRKVVDSAFSVIEMGSKRLGIGGLDEQEKIPLENIHEAVTKYPLFALIGDPGAGKTTTLRRLALDAAWERLNNTDAPIPLWRELPRWRDVQEQIEVFIDEGWGLDINLTVALVKGDVALYLDGLNEMGAKSKDRASSLKQWLKGPNRPQQAIVTCRTENYRDLELGITTVLVEELGETKIRAFAKNYLGQKADGFLKRVMPKYERDKEEDRHLFHLARNPFMLRALTMIYEALPDGDLPSNTGWIFQNLIKVLWKREKERKTAHWIPYDEMLQALSTLAFNMMEDKQATIVSLEYAQNYVPLALLQVADSANIVGMNTGYVRFYHQSMQEYLVTVYVISNIEEGAMIIFLAHMIDKYWREVFLMMASVPDYTAIFIEHFLYKLDQLVIQDQEIISLFVLADMKVNLAEQQAYKPATLRCLYIGLTLALSLALNLNFALDEYPYHARALALDHAITLARTLDRGHVLTLAPSSTQNQAQAFVINLALVLGHMHILALELARVHDRDPALALALARVLALELARDPAFDLTKHVSKELNLLELHEVLIFLQSPDVEDSYQHWQAFTQSIEKILAKYRQFQDWTFSRAKLEILSTYLQGGKLFVDCLNVAEVSNRQEIENRLLLPPT